MFAGIGGFRLALESAGGRCLLSCEMNRHSRQTYAAWFGDVPAEDVTKLAISKIPDHDILAAGFPCQPFSRAGVSKRNSLGRAHGFSDPENGRLFFQVAKI